MATSAGHISKREKLNLILSVNCAKLMAGAAEMTEIITATYEQEVLVPLQDPGLREHQAVRLQIVPPRVCVTAAVARRKVNSFVLDNVSYLMGGEHPVLAETDRLVWRVRVVLTYPTQGVVGVR